MSRLLAFAATILLTGCATTLRPDPAFDLTGEWEVTAVNGEPTGGGETFIFSASPPSGWTQFGCNTGGGALSIANGWLRTGDWIITAAGCPGDRGRFEGPGFAVLSEPAAIERGAQGSVRLRNRRGTLGLRPIPPPQLAGSEWTVTSLNGKPPPRAGAASIRFGTDEYVATFGCNRISGAYRQEGRIFRTQMSRQTERGCVNPDGTDSPAMAYEAIGFAIISRDPRVERVRSNAIELVSELGVIRLERAT